MHPLLKLRMAGGRCSDPLMRFGTRGLICGSWPTDSFVCGCHPGGLLFLCRACAGSTGKGTCGSTICTAGTRAATWARAATMRQRAARVLQWIAKRGIGRDEDADADAWRYMLDCSGHASARQHLLQRRSSHLWASRCRQNLHAPSSSRSCCPSDLSTPRS